MTGIIDYQAGNLNSVENALRRLGADYLISSELPVLSGCDRLILPGVGEASWAMARLTESGLDGFIRTFGRPVLGICLGMQLMCRYSEENDTECLGIFPNVVRRFPDIPQFKVPHVGWNSVTGLKSPLYDGIDENSYMYFVHSYYADVNEWTAASTEYCVKFSASLKKDNYFGCQFHPEKSGEAGERLLSNFLKTGI